MAWEEEKPSKRAEKAARTVILKRMFTPVEMERDPGLMLDLKDDIRNECSRLGEATNVVVFDVSNQLYYRYLFHRNIQTASLLFGTGSQ